MLRFLLALFTPFYRLATGFRNMLFSCGICRSYTPRVSSIGVGNLCVGGSGKTPHIEYLVRLLSESYPVCTLSRGYGRKTTGYLLANEQHGAQDLGDEPLQFHSKFPEISVCVDENRKRALQKIVVDRPETQVVLLDDVFQHRHVRCGLNILLTDYYSPFFKDYLLPYGRLRESRKGYRRADIIIVTKSPRIATLSPMLREMYLKDLNPYPHQKVYFSSIAYEGIHLLDGSTLTIQDYTYYHFLLLTGISNPYPMLEYLRTFTKEIDLYKYNDHHVFSKKDLQKIRDRYQCSISRNKYVITTEKDYMRLKKSPYFDLIKDLNFAYLPIHVHFYEEDQLDFNKTIIDYVRKNSNDS